VQVVELRNIEISLQGEKEPSLWAMKARIGGDGTMKLYALRWRDAAGRQHPLAKATLQISGPLAGRLRWNGEGQRQEFFLLPEPSDKPSL
jgi:hypothetical protein